MNTMKSLFIILITFISINAFAQRMVPAPVQDTAIVLLGGTAHLGNGTVINNSAIGFENGKITFVADASTIKIDKTKSKVIDCTGKQIYPGIIAANTIMGLQEIELVRATLDYAEIGSYNPNVRSLIAYNADSKVIPTVRSNGVLLCQVVPQGGVISGSSSVMQMDAWNWEDAQVKANDGIHLNWPSYFSYNFNNGEGSVGVSDHYDDDVLKLRDYFNQAKAWSETTVHPETNIQFDAMSGLFNATKTLYIHCDYEKEILNAIQFASDFHLHMVIVGGRDSYLCTDALKQNNVAVILGAPHSLPGGDDVDVDQPYKTAFELQKAGVLYCLSLYGSWQQRNLMFMAGTTAAHGITSEQALMSITGNTAKILGLNNYGTLETGKQASIIISSGDVLDMKTQQITMAFIDGRQIDLDNSQKDLFEIYKDKYGIK